MDEIMIVLKGEVIETYLSKSQPLRIRKKKDIICEE